MYIYLRIKNGRSYRGILVAVLEWDIEANTFELQFR